MGKNMNGKVSIIVPFYNTEEFLDKCIQSILKQTYKDIQLLLIDDGSTDNSNRIAMQYASIDERILVLYQKNSGQAVARNIALDIAIGDWIMFCDSDDYIKPNMVEEMVNYAKEYDTDIVLCATLFENEFRLSDKKGLYDDGRVFTNKEILKEYFTTNKIQSAPWGKLFRKELFSDIRFPLIRAREDYAIMHKLLGKSSAVVYCDKSLYVQYIRPGSTEYSKFNLNKLAVLDCDLDIQNYVKKYFPELYKYVAVNYADSLRNCMKDICRSLCIVEYKDTYITLKKKLEKECARLERENKVYNLSSHEIIFKHSTYFILREYSIGVGIKIKGYIKKIM